MNNKRELSVAIADLFLVDEERQNSFGGVSSSSARVIGQCQYRISCHEEAIWA